MGSFMIECKNSHVLSPKYIKKKKMYDIKEMHKNIYK